ncbi:MAG TPA: AAA family ATPase [Spirochaeta sp.]|nr:AAA family ATPase [Spirochaeta sp.]
MKRKAEKYLENWCRSPNRKPLIIRGARQTGKTSLVRIFAENSNLELIELNFEENRRYKDVFNTNDVQVIIQSLEIILDRKVDPKKSILFLDEIQAHPAAIAVLRYFYEKMPELPVIAAGSLLEFVLEDHSFSMPVGRIEFLYLNPMTFEEFLLADGAEQLTDYLNRYELDDEIPAFVHDSALEKLKTYFLIGGMPEVVKVYTETGSLLEADRAKYSIHNTFREDFNKFKGRQQLGNLQEVYDRLGMTVGRKIVYNSIFPDGKSSKTEKILALFENARLLYRAWLSSANGLPLKAELKRKAAKGIYIDIGLLLSLNGLSLDSLNNDDMFFSYSGELAEQFIGQHLLCFMPEYMKPEVYHWRREKSQSNAEIDYLVQSNNRILPIEVKSGKTGTLKSLHLFMEQKNLQQAVRFSTNTPIVESAKSSLSGSDYSYTLISLPLYMAENLSRLLQTL